MEQLKQIARPITHLDIVLLGAAVLFQGIDELGDQIKLAEVQNGIETLAEKPIEAREFLPVNRVTVNAHVAPPYQPTRDSSAPVTASARRK